MRKEVQIIWGKTIPNRWYCLLSESVRNLYIHSQTYPMQTRYPERLTNEYFPYSTEREYLDSFLTHNWKEEEMKYYRNSKYEVLSTLSNTELFMLYTETKIPDFNIEYRSRISPKKKETIDLNRIKNENLIPDILGQRYGVNYRNRAIRCIFPKHEDSSPSLSVTKDWKYFYCFGCNERGSVIDLIMKKEGKSFLESIKLLDNATT